MTQYVLLTYDDNYADEFNIHGLRVITKEQYEKSLGYNWKPGVKSYTEIPNYAQSLLGFTGRREGELHWFNHLFYLENNIDEWEEIFMPTNKHKHYDLIMQWAADPTQKVWYKTLTGWEKARNLPWREDTEYYIGDQAPPKRKIMLGDVEIDAPVLNEPQINTDYFVPMLTREDLHLSCTWKGDSHDLSWLKRGFIHLTEEAAILHATALIKISGGSV